MNEFFPTRPRKEGRLVVLLFLFLAWGTPLFPQEKPNSLSIDFSDGKADRPLDLKPVWQVSEGSVSPGVYSLKMNGNSILAVGPSLVPWQSEKREREPDITSVARHAVPPPFKDRIPNTVLVQACFMLDGPTKYYAAMTGFGKGTPIQFGLGQDGRIVVRDEQWGPVYSATDCEGYIPKLVYGNWYRITLEITLGRDQKSGTARLFLRSLSKSDKMIPNEKDVLLSFDVRGKRSEKIPVTVKNPVDSWDTVWVRTGRLSPVEDAGYISEINVSSAVGPLSDQELNRLPLVRSPQNVRSVEEIEKLLDLKKSDILLSSRWKRPVNANDPHDTFQAIAAFHATRMEWSYTVDPKYIDRVKESGIRRFAGTVNSLYNYANPRQYAEKAAPGHLTDRTGKPVTAPWMTQNMLWWGCVNSKEYRDFYAKNLESLIDAKVDSIHMDDQALNHRAVPWGACYCPYCVRDYRQFLKNRFLSRRAQNVIGNIDTFDIRSVESPPYFLDFQEESVRRFYADVREILRKKAGREVMFSCNGDWWHFPALEFDFAVAELGERNIQPKAIFEGMTFAEKIGKPLTFTLTTRNVDLNRSAYATCYACGGYAILPWDVYISPMSSPRIFIEAEQFADLPGFIRGVAKYLDGYSAGAAAGFGLDSSDSKKLLVMEENSGAEPKTSVFVRLKKGSASVVHLVDWGTGPKKVKLEIARNVLESAGTVKEVTFLAPPPYDAGLHEKARKSGDYSSLVVRKSLPVVFQDENYSVDVPLETTWGILVFENK